MSFLTQNQHWHLQLPLLPKFLILSLLIMLYPYCCASCFRRGEEVMDSKMEHFYSHPNDPFSSFTQPIIMSLPWTHEKLKTHTVLIPDFRVLNVWMLRQTDTQHSLYGQATSKGNYKGFNRQKVFTSSTCLLSDDGRCWESKELSDWVFWQSPCVSLYVKLQSICRTLFLKCNQLLSLSL